MIKFKCEKCNEDLEAPDSLIHAYIKCPKCNEDNRVPDLKSKNVIFFDCKGCMIELKTTLSMIGETLQCPKCYRINIVKDIRNYTPEVLTVLYVLLIIVNVILFFICIMIAISQESVEGLMLTIGSVISILIIICVYQCIKAFFRMNYNIQKIVNNINKQ